MIRPPRRATHRGRPAQAVRRNHDQRIGSSRSRSGQATAFRPVLRGLLLTVEAPRFLCADLAGGRGETSMIAEYPLWSPPGKIAGGNLARYLHRKGLPVSPPPAGPARVPVAIELPPDPEEDPVAGGPQRPLAARHG